MVPRVEDDTLPHAEYYYRWGYPPPVWVHVVRSHHEDGVTTLLALGRSGKRPEYAGTPPATVPETNNDHEVGHERPETKTTKERDPNTSNKLLPHLLLLAQMRGVR